MKTPAQRRKDKHSMPEGQREGMGIQASCMC